MTGASRLNFKHLRYFREVAERGSVSAAARALFVAPQTVSAQIQELEESIGQALFERVGRRLLLTTAGATALEYARNIFALGEELATVLGGRQRARVISLRVGTTDSVPKLMTVSLLQPVIRRHLMELELDCREGAYADLLGQLAAGQLDMVLSDTAVPANLTRALQARVVSDSGMTFVGAPALSRLKKDFPGSLDGAPFLAGAATNSMLSQSLEAWFARNAVRPHVVGRIDDSALLKGFAQQGLGVAAIPTSLETEVLRQHGLIVLGRTQDIRHSIFLLRARARRPHPLVAELESSRGQPR
jgi:LysR family transcriptional activator of nhaA